jgi:chromosome segregation ATPase
MVLEAKNKKSAKIRDLEEKLRLLRIEHAEYRDKQRNIPRALEELEKEMQRIDDKERAVAEELQVAQAVLAELKATAAAKNKQKLLESIVIREAAAVGRRKDLEEKKYRLGQFTDIQDFKTEREQLLQETNRLRDVLSDKIRFLNELTHSN